MSYFATACGHEHDTALEAARCPQRGFDVTMLRLRDVIEVTITPGRVTRTRVILLPLDVNESCGSCGADIGPSDSFPWHELHEDCRAIRDPLPALEDA